jgi:hypothetical protein
MVQTGWRANRHPTAVVPVLPLEDGSYVPANDGALSTVTWVELPWVTTAAASSTTILAAGLATKGIWLQNNHASETVNLTFSGTDATSTTGLGLAAGKSINIHPGEIPDAAIKGYSEGAGSVFVMYAV